MQLKLLPVYMNPKTCQGPSAKNEIFSNKIRFISATPVVGFWISENSKKIEIFLQRRNCYESFVGYL